MAGLKRFFEHHTNLGGIPIGMWFTPDDGGGDAGAGDGDAAEGDATDTGGDEGAGDTGDGDAAEGDSTESEGDAGAESAMSPEGSDDSEADDGDGSDADSKEGDGETKALEKYEDFTLPEGVEMNDEELAHFTPVLLDLEVSQEAAQKLIDTYYEMKEAGYQNANKEIERGREADLKALKEHDKLGGSEAAFKEAMAQAGRVLLLPGGKDVMDLFKAHGIDNNPKIVELFHTVSGMLSEDAIVNGAGGGVGKETNSTDAAFPTTVGL